jgi:3-phytase
MSRLFARTAAHLVLVSFLASSASAVTNWTVTRTNHLVIPGLATGMEMSGITYKDGADLTHRFIVALDSGAQLLNVEVTFDATGNIVSATNLAPTTIASPADFEGIAYTNPTRNSVFLSDEQPAGPGIRELNLATGKSMRMLTIPTVITANERSNRGFESLTRSRDGKEMWTATEEALTVDGPAATGTNGTIVRLLKFNVNGDDVAVGPQYAYEVSPNHGTSTVQSPQSGLVDLVDMPDGTLLALERSVVVGTPVFQNRVFEINFNGATDVSVGPTAGGLIGQTYTKATKQSLWTGAADGALGQNLEGLALGPRLANGSWVLLGVVDDHPGDIDTLSMNTLVAFVATPQISADFNSDGEVDGADLLAWQRGNGKTVGARLTDGDADRDGDVDGADLQQWKAAAASAATFAAVPEPGAAALAVLCAGSLLRAIRRRKAYR